jgi:hypothetical protein
VIVIYPCTNHAIVDFKRSNALQSHDAAHLGYSSLGILQSEFPQVTGNVAPANPVTLRRCGLDTSPNPRNGGQLKRETTRGGNLVANSRFYHEVKWQGIMGGLKIVPRH